MASDTLRERILLLPASPGVYLMKDRSGRVLYVGKAKSLRSRVSSYFQDSADLLNIRGPEIARMAAMVAEVDFLDCETEVDALLTEARLTASPGGHQTGSAFEAQVDTGRREIVAEFAHWPVGWVYSWHDSDIPELCEVTNWLDMDYKSRRSVTISVPRVWTSTGFPLDYRTPDQVERDTRRNLGLA